MVDECLDITNVNLDLDFTILFFWAWISGYIYLVNFQKKLHMYMLVVIKYWFEINIMAVGYSLF